MDLQTHEWLESECGMSSQSSQSPWVKHLSFHGIVGDEVLEVQSPSPNYCTPCQV